jgi:hypothetical protein
MAARAWPASSRLMPKRTTAISRGSITDCNEVEARLFHNVRKDRDRPCLGGALDTPFDWKPAVKRGR